MNLVLKFKHELFMILNDYQAYLKEHKLTMSVKESQAYKSILESLKNIEDVLDLKEKVTEITLTLKKTWLQEFFESEEENLLYKSLVVHLKDPQYSKTKLLHAQTKEIRKFALKFPTEEFHRLQEENSELLQEVNVLQSRLEQMETALNQEREKNKILTSENAHLKELQAEFYAHTPINFVPQSEHEELKRNYLKLEEDLSQAQTEKSELVQSQDALTEKLTQSESAIAKLQSKNKTLQQVHLDLFQQNLSLAKEIKDLQNKHGSSGAAPAHSQEFSAKSFRMF